MKDVADMNDQDVTKNRMVEKIMSKLHPKIKIQIQFLINKLSDFGIKSNRYQIQQGIINQTGITQEDQVGIYYYTTDISDDKQLWFPLIYTGGQPLKPLPMTFRYLVPQNYTVVSSGTLLSKVIEASGEKRALYNYSLTDENDHTIPQKVGFVVGQFQTIHKMQDLQTQFKSLIGGAYSFFINQKKAD